jgi:hypothetical protein
LIRNTTDTSSRIAREHVRASEWSPLVDVAKVAEHLGVSKDWVYSHADEIGARRLGSGPKARLRFILAEVDERLTACTASRGSLAPESGPLRRPLARRCKPVGRNAELLPVRGVTEAC